MKALKEANEGVTRCPLLESRLRALDLKETARGPDRTLYGIYVSLEKRAKVPNRYAFSNARSDARDNLSQQWHDFHSHGDPCLEIVHSPHEQAGLSRGAQRFLNAAIVWPARRDSNPRPSVPKTDALSTELRVGEPLLIVLRPARHAPLTGCSPALSTEAWQLLST